MKRMLEGTLEDDSHEQNSEAGLNKTEPSDKYGVEERTIEMVDLKDIESDAN